MEEYRVLRLSCKDKNVMLVSEAVRGSVRMTNEVGIQCAGSLWSRKIMQTCRGALSKTATNKSVQGC